MKHNILYISFYMFIFCVAHVVSDNLWRNPKSTRNLMRSPEGSGSYPGSGPGTDDEDGKLPQRSSPSNVRRPLKPGPTYGTLLKNPKTFKTKPLPRDEGSGSTEDSEKLSYRPTEKIKATEKGPLTLNVDKRKKEKSLPTVRSNIQNRGCKAVAASGRTDLMEVPYSPHCDENGDYAPLQCSTSDCFCVNTKDGTIIESTRMVPASKIRCHWVRHRIQIPLSPVFLQSEKSKKAFRKELMTVINGTEEHLFGRNYFIFKKFFYHRLSRNEAVGAEVECRSIGLPDTFNFRAKFLALIKDFSKLGNLVYLNVTETTGKTEVRQLGAGSGFSGGLEEESGRLAGDEPIERLRMMRTADTANAGKSEYSVRNGEDTKPPGDEPKPASGASPSKKENKKKIATLFEQPGIIAAIIGGGIAAFLLAILLILFCIYRIRKKDEGSYALEEPKKTPVSAAVYHSAPTREYYA